MIKNPLRLIPPLISVILLTATVFLTAQSNTYIPTATETSTVTPQSSQTNSKPITPSQNENSTLIEETEEVRAVWIPFMTLDMGDTDRSEKAFQEKIDAIMDNCSAKNFNTIFVHVRPFGDAIYPSQYYPWSHIISGTQGQAPDYDPLAYIVQSAHQHNLKIHAWVNPLRVRYSQTPSVLSSDNPYNLWKNDATDKNDDYIVEYENGIYYNPAYPEVRKYIINGILEIVENYAVDGIHFDDYFYPTENADFDQTAYDNYCQSVDDTAEPLTLTEWRKSNINALIAGVYSSVHSVRDDIVFGISPQGNIENDELMCADVTQWCCVQGYIDYICPQIYVSNSHPILPFSDTAARWRSVVTYDEIQLYGGLGLYKAGTDADEGTWLKSNEEIKTQIETVRELGFDGFALYSYEYLETPQTAQEIQNVMALLNQSD